MLVWVILTTVLILLLLVGYLLNGSRNKQRWTFHKLRTYRFLRKVQSSDFTHTDHHMRKNKSTSLIDEFRFHISHYLYHRFPVGLTYFKIHLYDPIITTLLYIQECTRFIIPFSPTPFKRRHYSYHNQLSDIHVSSFSDENTFFPDSQSGFDSAGMPTLEFIGTDKSDQLLATCYPRFTFHALKKRGIDWNRDDIEPAFLNEEDYPDDWLVYDPIQECVVTKKKRTVQDNRDGFNES